MNFVFLFFSVAGFLRGSYFLFLQRGGKQCLVTFIRHGFMCELRIHACLCVRFCVRQFIPKETNRAGQSFSIHFCFIG